MNFFFRQKQDPRILPYQQGTRRKWDKSLEAEAARFVILDLETSGFSAHQDRILSIAAIPVSSKQCSIGELRNWLIYHSDAIITPATEVHTILPSDSSRGISEEAALLELLKMLEGAILVGHHIHFDASMLQHALAKHFRTGLRNPLLDTANMAMKCLDSFHRTGYSNQKPPSLDEVCSNLGLPLWQRHTADGDTFGTAQLFLMLCSKTQAKLGRPLTLRDLPIYRPIA